MPRLISAMPGSADAKLRSAAGGKGTIATFRLDNGMDALVIVDRRSPIATHMIWYRNGASQDPLGKAGLAHFLEHLMFKGTERSPQGQFTRELAAFGGQENAFTSWAFTSYYQRVPVEHLRGCMLHEADRMFNLKLSETQLASEKDVVLAERGMMTDSNPQQRLQEALHAAAFPAHPYGRPVIGWRDEIQSLQMDDVMAYYRRFYRPDNAILVVAGDVDPDEVRHMATEIYGPLKAEGFFEPATLPVPPRSNYRQTVAVSDPAVMQPILQRFYTFPATASDPALSAALSLLMHLLGGDQTSVLHKALVVRDGVAAQLGCQFTGNYFPHCAFGGIVCIPAPGTTLSAMEEALDRALDDARANGFTDAEIARAKTVTVANAVFSRDSHQQLAMSYATALCCGRSVDAVTAWESEIDAVTPELLQTALRLLDPKGAVSGHLQADRAQQQPVLAAAE